MEKLSVEKRQFGDSDIEVSALGYGAGHIGSPDMSEKKVQIIIESCLEAGINLFDTARAYGLSEERLGRYLKPYRDDVVLSTKVGYGVDGVEDWTPEAILQGTDEARQKLDTDTIDILHLHSCDRHILTRPEISEAIHTLKDRGWAKLVCYSGENEHLDYAVTWVPIDGIQCSINILDQRVIHTTLPKAKQRSMGVIAKRPLANAPWRFDTFPEGHYAAVYWKRMQNMDLPEVENLNELALRFTTFTYGVDSSIVGTTNPDHLSENVVAVNKGKLPEQQVQQLIASFRENDKKWVGQV